MKNFHFAAILCLIISLFFRAIPSAAETVGIRTEGKFIFIENESFLYIISSNGSNESFFDKNGNQEYLDTSRPRHFMTLQKGGRSIPASSVLLDGDELVVRFDPDWTIVRTRVDVRDNYFVFEVSRANSDAFEELVFCDLPLSIGGNIGGSLNVCRSETFGVSMQALNFFTNCRFTGYRPAVRLTGSAYPEFNHIGTRLALLAGPAGRMLELTGVLEREQGLPHPTFEGKWAKTSREAEESYLFIDYTEANIDRAIEFAKQGGFKYLMMYLDTWAKTCGKYQYNLENYPRGIESVKATVEKIHAAGLKAGAHTMSGSIYKFDEYVTPIPDKRLAKDGERILAADVGPDDDFIPTTKSPEGFSLLSSYLSEGGTDLQIGDELITYSGYNTREPYGFTGCARGAHGTFKAGHKKSDTVYHMAERYEWYMVGGKTSMVEEVARNIADVINSCGFDQVYYDGSEALAGQGPYWYYVGKMIDAICSRFDREVLVQGSSMPHFNWHQYSRGGQIDWAWQDQKRFVDWYTEQSIQGWKYNNFMPTEFGWYGYFTERITGESSVPDEIEHVLNKCLAYDASWSFETNMATLEKHGRTGEILEISRNYQSARMSRYFPEGIKKKLREQGKDFKLEADGKGGWTISPILYGPDKYVKRTDGVDNSWSYVNPYSPQPLKVRIKARPEPAAYDDPENIPLLGPADIGKMTSSSAGPALSLDLAVSNEQVKTGTASIRLASSNPSAEKSKWAGKTLDFPEPLNLNTHHPIGFWLYGDASNAVLDVQLQDPKGVALFNHIVKLDFSGWKYMEFLQQSGMESYEYDVPGYQLIGIRGSNFRQIARVLVCVTEIPAGASVECFLSPIKALKEYRSTVTNPALSVNGNSIRFPLTLEMNHYMEFWGSGKASLYDTEGHVLKEVEPDGDVPMLRPGDNAITVACESAAGDRQHARVTIITKGDPLRE